MHSSGLQKGGDCSYTQILHLRAFSLGFAKMVALGVFLGLLLVLLIVCSCLLRWNELRYRKKGLPPGTMGWPLIGETTEFLKQGHSFMKNQRARYGDLFKTHILGSPTIVCMDVDLNRYIIMNEAKGLVPGYPKSMQDMLGKWNIAAVQGPVHKSLRNAMLGMVGPAAMKDELRKIDEFMSSHIRNWNDQVIDIQEKTKELWLYSSLKQIASIENGPFAMNLKSELKAFVLGAISLPINLPGTYYRRGVQARHKIVTMFQELIDERRARPCCKDDLLHSLLRSDNVNAKQKLSDEQIIDLMLILVYSGFETVSTTSMMTVKYLHDHPRALEEIRSEQMEIRRRKSAGETIDWNDYKSMVFTRAVIFETLRLATVVNGVLRKATQDIELEGIVIPKGWRIYVYMREHNYDSSIYPEPFKFNPWRWLDNSLESNPNFMQFGGGLRLCPGKEMGLVKVAVFLHHFVTRYRWEEVGGDKLLKFPRVEAPKGLHMRVSKLN